MLKGEKEKAGKKAGKKDGKKAGKKAGKKGKGKGGDGVVDTGYGSEILELAGNGPW